jgi:phenylacetate-CoA ligase
VPHVLQTYASADIGSIAYETASNGKLNPGMVSTRTCCWKSSIRAAASRRAGRSGRSGGHRLQSRLSADPLCHGRLSAVLTDAPDSPCGRTNTRIKGWMGRADQTTKVRAMFVHPSQVHEIARRHPQIRKARLVVSGAWPTMR